MMKEQWMEVLNNRPIALDTYEMTLHGKLASSMTQPGQFLHLKIGDGFRHVLRRPLSIADVDQEDQTVKIIYKVIGEGTKWLSQAKPGNQIHVLGPRGHGFPVENVADQHIYLIGGGVGVPPLYYLGKQLAENNRVTAVLGFQTKDAVFYEEKFQELGETMILTDDGSYGKRGLVTDVLESKMDLYYSCGPLGMLHAVTRKLNDVKGYVSLEERMGCGIGACFACVCKTTDPNDERGYRKICKDGPVFPAKEVVLWQI
ncbi:MAG: dihydroorotate dehydrogenase electron transfer subunit [Bacillaceae bacterium]|nr:dihydroorotate dehydrogenase electron transfer subunit [Bacillaceae bacterium]